MSIERNKRIVERRVQGWSLKKIAEVEGLAYGTVLAIYRRDGPRPGDGPVPEGMSIHTARDIVGVTCIWPSEETAPEIAGRMMEIMRGCRKRHTMKETADWLQTLGIQH